MLLACLLSIYTSSFIGGKPATPQDAHAWVTTCIGSAMSFFYWKFQKRLYEFAYKYLTVFHLARKICLWVLSCTQIPCNSFIWARCWSCTIYATQDWTQLFMTALQPWKNKSPLSQNVQLGNITSQKIVHEPQATVQSGRVSWCGVCKTPLGRVNSKGTACVQ